jgi:TctA family transporter
MIIGPILEIQLRQSLMSSGGALSIFWERPIALTLIIISGFLGLWNIYRSLKPTKAAWEKALEDET